MTDFALANLKRRVAALEERVAVLEGAARPVCETCGGAGVVSVFVPGSVLRPTVDRDRFETRPCPRCQS